MVCCQHPVPKFQCIGVIMDVFISFIRMKIYTYVKKTIFARTSQVPNSKKTLGAGFYTACKGTTFEVGVVKLNFLKTRCFSIID